MTCKENGICDGDYPMLTSPHDPSFYGKQSNLQKRKSHMLLVTTASRLHMETAVETDEADACTSPLNAQICFPVMLDKARGVEQSVGRNGNPLNSSSQLSSCARNPPPGQLNIAAGSPPLVVSVSEQVIPNTSTEQLPVLSTFVLMVVGTSVSF